MKFKKVTIAANWSVYHKESEVELIRFENAMWLVRYSDGYTEWLPQVAIGPV